MHLTTILLASGLHSSKSASNVVADRAAAAAAWQTRLGVSPQATQASKQYDEWEASLVKEAQAAAAKEEGHETDSPPPPAAEEDEPEARNSGVGGVHIAMIYPATLGSSDFNYHVGDKIATPSELHAASDGVKSTRLRVMVCRRMGPPRPRHHDRKRRPGKIDAFAILP